MRAAVEATHALEAAGLSQILFDEAYVALIVESVPDGDRLIWKAAVREGDDRGGADLQDTPDLAQDLDGPGQVVDLDTDPHAVELAIAKGQLGVGIQVLDHVGVEPWVLLQLDLVHAQADHATVRHLGAR